MLQGGAAVSAPCALVPQAVVQNVVRSTLSLAFVIAGARFVFNIKVRPQQHDKGVHAAAAAASSRSIGAWLPGACERDPAAAERLVAAICEEGESRRAVHVRRQPQMFGGMRPLALSHPRPLCPACTHCGCVAGLASMSASAMTVAMQPSTPLSVPISASVLHSM